MRVGGAVRAAKGTRTGALVLAGGPKVRINLGAPGETLPFVGGGPPFETRAFDLGADLVPEYLELLKQTTRTATDLDREAVQLLTSDDDAGITMRANQGMVIRAAMEGAPWAGTTGRSQLCFCGSGKKTKVCCCASTTRSPRCAANVIARVAKPEQLRIRRLGLVTDWSQPSRLSPFATMPSSPAECPRRTG